MQAKGFGTRRVAWIQEILSTGTTEVLLNGTTEVLIQKEFEAEKQEQQGIIQTNIMFQSWVQSFSSSMPYNRRLQELIFCPVTTVRMTSCLTDD